MVSKGAQNLLVNLGIVVLVIVVIYVVIIRNPKALDWLKGIGSRIGAAKVGAASVGDTVPGPNVYPVVASISPAGNTRCNTAGGGDGEDSFRDNVSFLCNHETTWFVKPGSSGGIESCSDLSKMGSHGGSSDPTALISFRQIPLVVKGENGEAKGHMVVMEMFQVLLRDLLH